MLLELLGSCGESSAVPAFWSTSVSPSGTIIVANSGNTSGRGEGGSGIFAGSTSRITGATTIEIGPSLSHSSPLSASLSESLQLLLPVSSS